MNDGAYFVIGAGVGGLTSGMLLARDGHDVTVLERDAAAPPATADEAWNDWERRGVNQFRMIHLFAPRFRSIIETELPDVVAEAEALGALHYNAMRLVPEEMIGGYRPDDDNFDAHGAPARHGGGARPGRGAHAEARGAARRRRGRARHRG